MKLDAYLVDFNGLLVVGDIHASYSPFFKSVEYAKRNNLLLVSLGDLLDYGFEAKETLQLASELVKEHRGFFVRGNHDDKFLRFYSGNSVRFNDRQQQTISQFRDHTELKVLLESIFKSDMAGYYCRHNNFLFAHASFHSSFWDQEDIELTKKMKHMFLYGEVDGTIAADGYPHRTYDWVNSIPSFFHVVVGHDRRPLGKYLHRAESFVNSDDGIATFIDTACGKGGYLTGMHIESGKYFFKQFW